MYESFYGLNAKPFRLRPDPRFFFASRGHKRAMAYLEYGLDQGEGFIVITGEIGAGKTTLVRNLLNQLKPEEIVAAHVVHTRLDAEETLRTVVAAFGLPHQGADKTTLLVTLERFLRETEQAGKRALLVVDEAQNLSPRAVEELRMLSNFQTDDNSLLQTFLLGQPEFRATLHSPGMAQLRQRVIATYHLAAMGEDETRAYIEHRLATVGWQGDPAFSDAAVQAIHAFSGGIPRIVNTLCDRLMLNGFLEELHGFEAEHVNAVIDDIRSEQVGGAPAGAEAVSPAAPRPAQDGLPDLPPQALDDTPPQPGSLLRAAAIHAPVPVPLTPAAAPLAEHVPMDERVVRIENSVGSLLSLLKKLIGPHPALDNHIDPKK